MRERSSMYFSFPSPRDSVLALGKDVRGTFLLRYGSGHLTERIEKSPGAPAEFAVYAGPARLIRVERGAVRGQQDLELRAGARLVVSTVEERPPQAAIGGAVE